MVPTMSVHIIPYAYTRGASCRICRACRVWAGIVFIHRVPDTSSVLLPHTLKLSTLAIPPAIVCVETRPKIMAPPNSKMAAMMVACRVRALDQSDGR